VVGDLAALQALARRTLLACYPSVLGAAAVAASVDGGAADAYLAVRLPAGSTWCLEAAGALVGVAVADGPTLEQGVAHLAVLRIWSGTPKMTRPTPDA
jgi:hypothetical protein